MNLILHPFDVLTFIITGVDTIIAAETGSGKTLSYLLPLLQTFLTNADTIEANSSTTESVSVDALQGLQWYPPAVIVVPTKELAQQVAAMAKPLLQALEEQQKFIALGKKEIVHFNDQFITVLFWLHYNFIGSVRV